MSDPAEIRVMLVDDHDIVRGGLAALLEAFDDLVLVGEAASGEDALILCPQVTPDVILMDLMMPGMGGIEAIRALHAQHPALQIVALTTFREEDLVQSALQAGAISYLLKNVSIDELAEAIRGAYVGQSTLAPEATQALIKAATRAPQLGHDLTGRELEVLELMSKGMSNNEIAQVLTISRSTVKNHVSNILSKLDATNRAEAVALALQHSLVDGPDE